MAPQRHDYEDPKALGYCAQCGLPKGNRRHQPVSPVILLASVRLARGRVGMYYGPFDNEAHARAWASEHALTVLRVSPLNSPEVPDGPRT